MHKPLSQDEISTLNLKTTTMTRREKLLRWAEIVRKHPTTLRLYSNLEHYHPEARRGLMIDSRTAFALAVADPILRDAGLTGNTVGDIETFFDLSSADLHVFSCDCGGAISNQNASDRINHLAGRDEPGIVAKTIARLRS